MKFGIQQRPKVRTTAGLDIGSHDIKMVEISSGNGKPLVTSFSLKGIDYSAKEDLSGVLKAMAASSNITAKEINISVSGQSVIIRFLSMPRMSREEMSSAIRFEAEKHIPFNINECVVDFQVLHEYPKENKSDVLLVAAKKDFVEGRVKLVRDAGFVVGVVDVDSLAVANAFLKNYPRDNAAQEKTALLLDIGASSTHLAILKGQILCLVRDVSIGGKDFNSAVAKAFNLDNKNADDIKRVLKEKPQEALVPIRAVMNNLFDEIRLSCSYYENQCGRAIDQIYISGGGSGIAGLPGSLQESFGIKPENLNPFQALDTVNIQAGELEKYQNQFTVAVGLALR